MMPNTLAAQATPLGADPAAAAPPGPQDATGAPPAPDAAQAPPDAPAAPPEPAPDTGEPGTDSTVPTLASAGIDPEKLQKAIHDTAVMDAKLTAILDKSTNGQVQRGDVIKMMTEIVATGIMSPQSAAQYLSDIPEDPGDLREWVQRHANEGLQLLVKMVYAQHGSEATPPTGSAMPPTAEPAAPPPGMGMPQQA